MVPWPLTSWSKTGRQLNSCISHMMANMNEADGMLCLQWWDVCNGGNDVPKKCCWRPKTSRGTSKWCLDNSRCLWMLFSRKDSNLNCFVQFLPRNWPFCFLARKAPTINIVAPELAWYLGLMLSTSLLTNFEDRKLWSRWSSEVKNVTFRKCQICQMRRTWCRRNLSNDSNMVLLKANC
jgi:hypothetical protein